MSNWTPTSKQLPPDGEVVQVMDSGGHVQDLKRRGNLWWTPDMGMYVYFVPQFWKRKEGSDT